jgi:hypothetical protein
MFAGCGPGPAAQLPLLSSDYLLLDNVQASSYKGPLRDPSGWKPL